MSVTKIPLKNEILRGIFNRDTYILYQTSKLNEKQKSQWNYKDAVASL